jgi:hypothetical protein
VCFASLGLATRRRVVNQLASSEGSVMPSAGSIRERIGQRDLPNLICLPAEAGQRPRSRASTFRATSVNAGIACRQPADRGPVELVASLREQGYEPIVKEACER